MDNSGIAENLRALAGTSQNRSKIGRVRELYPDIQQAKSAGVSLETMLETINSNGLDMTMATFKSCLHRLRKEMTAQGSVPAAAPPAVSTPKRGEMSNVVLATPEEEREDETEYSSLSTRERREKKASRFITPESSNPLLKNLQNKGTKK